MKTKSIFYMSLVLLIALFATVQTAIAQIPCGPTPSPSPTLVVNWPQWQYDAAHSGCNPYEHILNRSNVKGLKAKWGQGAGYDAWYSMPVVADGVLYVSLADWDADNVSVLALNARTGAEIWSYREPDIQFFSPVMVNGMVYVGAQDWRNNDSYLYALNARTGTLIWKYTLITGVQATTPSVAVVNGMVYVAWGVWGGGKGSVLALSASTGALIWEYPVAAFSSPAVGNGIVYIGSYDYNVYALDASTGALIWSYPTGSQYWPSASVVKGVVYAAGDAVYALNANTGALIWEYPIASNWPAVANGVVYASSGQNLYALNAATGALVWKSDDFPFFINPEYPGVPVVANGVVYVNTELSTHALDTSTGAFLWSEGVGAHLSSLTSPMVANGMVYFANNAFYPNTPHLSAYSLNGQ